MSDLLPPGVFSCTQCGGELHPDEGQLFLTCPFCNSTVYLDKTQVVFHWYLAPTLDEAKARASLARWMAGNQTVKDLDKKSSLVSITFAFFPMWYFKQHEPGGREAIFLLPAAATSVSELTQLDLPPAGDLRKYDASLDPQAQLPTVPLPLAITWLKERRVPSDQVVERALVHIPIFTCKYEYKGTQYTAIVEAGTGSVFANIYPAKAEAPYQIAGIVTALVYLCLAVIPLAGAAMGEEEFLIGLGICLSLGLIAAPFLFGLAVWVAAKI